MLIAIRTDASSATGLGHLKRCLSLAHAMRELGAEVQFVLQASDVDGAAIAAADGFAAHVLRAAPAAFDDAAAFCALWSGTLPDAVVVDHYGLDARWHTAVQAQLGCSIAAIDDLANRPLAVDSLVDQNCVPAPGHRAKYAAVLRHTPALWLCGPRFALLGPAYAQTPGFEVRPAVQSIGIFLGGTDPAGLSATVVHACRDVARFSGPIEVASTSANPRLAALRALSATDARLSLSLDQPDLGAFFQRHDLQIGAGGGSTWERCSVGVPTLTLCIADNQRAVIPALQALGALASVERNDVESLGRAVAALIESPAARRQLSERSRALVDGQGASRVALALLAACPAGLCLRPATQADALTLWQWRNAPAARNASRQTEAIPFEAHQAWLAGTLADPQRHLSVARVGSREVGSIRFDHRADGNWEVSLYLDPVLHGLGLGSALLRRGEADLLARAGPVRIHAEVLPSNPVSQRLFATAGYHNDHSTVWSKSLAARAGSAASLPESIP